jgi:hypothetical protein
MRIQDFDFFAIDVEQAVLWQYQNSTNLRQLIDNKQNWLFNNQQSFWLLWQDTVFNLCTDNPTIFGMVVWSIILNIPVYIPIGEEPTPKPIWGFNAFAPSYPDLENTYKNFGTTITANPGSGNFSTRGQFFALTVEQQQFLLRLRYFQLCNLGDINDINQFLNHLCIGNTIGYTGTIYVEDNLDMTITYVFTTSDFPVALFSIINDLDVFPRPAGVARV